MKMNLKFFGMAILTLASLLSHAQTQNADTVIVPLANTSKMIFIMKDRGDLKILEQYDFQALFKDVLKRIELSDTIKKDTTVIVREVIKIETDDDDRDDDDSEDDDKDWDGKGHRHKDRHFKHGKVGRTWQSTNIDLGINNYLSGDQFPDGNELYAVRPWGSWYVAVNSVQRTRIAKSFFMEWGLGVSWYNFKFQEDNIAVTKDDVGVHFTADPRDLDFIKSKLSATYINASLIPVIDIGDHHHGHRHRMWEDDHSSDFRFGVGPYLGYRIGSRSKLVYEEGDDKEKEKNKDNFYLNDLRYGVRLQLGVRSTDFFFNYDMNELFSENKGPKLNAISFGVIF